MSQITRCPFCATQFKVVPDQLRISEGWVRCGQCKQIFDAREHLQTIATATTKHNPADSAPPRPAAPPPTATSGNPYIAASATSTDFSAEEEPAPLKLELPQPKRKNAPESAPIPAPPPVPTTLSSAQTTTLPALDGYSFAPPIDEEPEETQDSETEALVAVLDIPPAQTQQAGTPSHTPNTAERPSIAPVARAQETASVNRDVAQQPIKPSPPEGYALPTAVLPELDMEWFDTQTPEPDLEEPEPFSLPLDIPAPAPSGSAPPKAIAAVKPARPVPEKPTPALPAEPLWVADTDRPFVAPTAAPASPPPRSDITPNERQEPIWSADDALHADLTAAPITAPATAKPRKTPRPTPPPPQEHHFTPSTDNGPSFSFSDALASQTQEAPTPPATGQEEQAPSFMRARKPPAGTQQSTIRIGLALVSLLLVCTLAAQVLLQHRHRLAATQPQWRPLLEVLCMPVGCKVGPYRQIASVVVESSAFNKTATGAYQFSIGLRNRAAFSVEMPAVELTLTDSHDVILLRRVFTPSDLQAPTELAARGEWNTTVLMQLSTGGSMLVSGYRVLAFYP